MNKAHLVSNKNEKIFSALIQQAKINCKNVLIWWKMKRKKYIYQKS